MRAPNYCRSLLALGAFSLAGCGGETAGPSPLRRADLVEMRIQGFPASAAIRLGESMLLSIAAESDVESIVWTSSDSSVLSSVATPRVSPCGSACVWARGESAGTARLRARVCFVDGSCADVGLARVGGADGALRDVPTQLSVVP